MHVFKLFPSLRSYDVFFVVKIDGQAREGGDVRILSEEKMPSSVSTCFLKSSEESKCWERKIK